MIQIIADDRIPFLKGVLEPYAEVSYLPGNEINNKVIIKADALLIRTRTRCNEGLLQNSHVKFVGTATIGFDHIDTKYCESQGITWVNAPGSNSHSVCQYVASALAYLSRLTKESLSGKTIGIIGVGNVGSKVENLAKILGMKVLLNDPPRALREPGIPFVSLEEVFASADIITLHVPLSYSGSDRTHHLINETTLAQMKKGAWFLNTSRGEVVESASLKSAISEGRIEAAVLDVWENEPRIDLELLNMVKIATPHIAGYSLDGKATGTAMVVNSVSRHFDLSLNGWYPHELPLPQHPQIRADDTGKEIPQLLAEIMASTYIIEEDDRRLRTSPANFERLREDYPLRREYPAYRIESKNMHPAVIESLKKLRFTISDP